MPAHVRKGDQVIVTSGDHKGKVGEVLRVMPDDDKVLVKGVNVVTRNTKPSRLNPQGGQMSKELPIHISKVSPVVDGKPSRVRFEIKPDGSKVRVAVRGGKTLGQVAPARKHPAKPAAPVGTGKLSRETRTRLRAEAREAAAGGQAKRPSKSESNR